MLKPLAFATCVVALMSGCASIHYESFWALQVEPVAAASGVEGRFGDERALIEKMGLPHLTERERYELYVQVMESYTAQLGSPDYELMGMIRGKGNAYLGLPKLREKMLGRAAREGSNVILFMGAGVDEQPYAYTVPGRSQTTVTGSSVTHSTASAYGGPGYACGSGTSSTHGSAQAQTIYTPSQTVAGVNYIPWAHGLVFRYVPYSGRMRRTVLELDDESLARFLAEVDEISGDTDLTFDEAHGKQVAALRRYLARVERPQETNPATQETDRQTKSFEEWLAENAAKGQQ